MRKAHWTQQRLEESTMFPMFNSTCGCANQARSNPMAGMNPMMGMMGLMGIVTMLMQMMEMAMANTVMGQNPMFARPGQFGAGSPGMPVDPNPLNTFLGGQTNPTGGAAPFNPGGGSFAPNTPGVSPRTQDFINKAKAKQGSAYVFGAESNGQYDCSGLVYASLKEAGVNVPRLTARDYQARYKNSQVSKENLKPGDLVFFHSKNDRGIPAGKATHIEIYLGNGMTMGTDNPREGARIEPINWNTFIGGARVPELQS